MKENLFDRFVTDSLRERLEGFPIVGVVGPRQVGKTTLVREQLFGSDTPHHYLDLENPQDLRLLDEAYDYLGARADVTVVIDEIQVRPELFTVLRPLIDAQRRPGRFVLLGSASPALIRGANESLAGRISYLELAPLTLAEVAGRYPASDHWLRGGYPASLRAGGELSYEWRASYIESYLTKELPGLGGVESVDLLRRLVYMLAGQQGALLNQSGLAKSLGTSQPTVRRYVALLEQSFLIRQLRPYAVNVRKRLVKSPKVYLRDSGLLHVLSRVETAEQLSRNIVAGASWEGYVVEQVAQAVSRRAELYFYRTHAGAEVDIVIIGRRGRMACVEVKHSSAPSLSRGFYSALEDLGPERTFVVAPVREAYARDGGITVAPLTEVVEALDGW